MWPGKNGILHWYELLTESESAEKTRASIRRKFYLKLQNFGPGYVTRGFAYRGGAILLNFQ